MKTSQRIEIALAGLRSNRRRTSESELYYHFMKSDTRAHDNQANPTQHSLHHSQMAVHDMMRFPSTSPTRRSNQHAVNKAAPKTKSIQRITRAMMNDGTDPISSSFDLGHSSSNNVGDSESHVEAGDGQQRCTADTGHSKLLVMPKPKPLSLRDMHFEIGALDKLVGKDESLLEHPYEKGTFRDWQHMLAQSQAPLLREHSVKEDSLTIVHNAKIR